MYIWNLFRELIIGMVLPFAFSFFSQEKEQFLQSLNRDSASNRPVEDDRCSVVSVKHTDCCLLIIKPRGIVALHLSSTWHFHFCKLQILC